ncbi:formin-binding protein 1-like isoform X8 [Crassostrea angulata]|uniref:formin-binding protein 1-like isoform X8 n=1 Tax=Magallana angulata TaxID=2784310 RepID=UPI000975361F|nr:formin-binding protein 1-like isoform X8 [Crassostrea gigas]XP_052720409.1 formin-binding protein 1-like isoform X8 [Crassostrea angulata]|eukprot:XP_019921325.1 PREDICTED: formin-binding protein 1-like isoform X5 [Crassostrea gigas]
MSWGIELWDQYDTIASHTQKGIDFCERFTHFLKDRCAIELKYASELKKLVKNYQPKKKEEEEYQQYSWAVKFWEVLKELHDLAGQHEVIAENTQGQVIKDVQILIGEMKQQRRKDLQDGAKVQDTLKDSLAKLDKSRKNYEKAFKMAEKATDDYRKADADINLSRAEVEKTRNQMMIKNNQCDESKNEYAAQLQQTNQHQRDHYTQQMPAVFQQMQSMEENRINKIKSMVRQVADIERSVIPIINTCIDGMVKASDGISAEEDSKAVIDKFKSGFPIPEDIPFEDLSNASVIDTSNANGTPKNSLDSRKGTVSDKKRNKKDKKGGGGLFGIFSSSKSGRIRGEESKEDFSDLPPNQQRKALNKKIEEFKKEIARETAEREGMLKMKDVYVNNPALGDPNALEKKIEENALKIDSLQAEMRKFQGYLANMDGKPSPAGQRRSSLSDDSISQSSTNMEMSQTSIPGQPQIVPNEPEVYTEDWPEPPSDEEFEEERAVELRKKEDKKAIDDEDGDHVGEFDHPEGDFDEEGYPVIGTCRALYPYEAGNEGSVAMGEGEEMFVLEQDQGDGWTRVRKHDNSEGFVPTSYIQCHFYDQDEV